MESRQGDGGDSRGGDAVRGPDRRSKWLTEGRRSRFIRATGVGAGLGVSTGASQGYRVLAPGGGPKRQLPSPHLLRPQPFDRARRCSSPAKKKRRRRGSTRPRAAEEEHGGPCVHEHGVFGSGGPGPGTGRQPEQPGQVEQPCDKVPARPPQSSASCVGLPKARITARGSCFTSGRRIEESTPHLWRPGRYSLQLIKKFLYCI